MSPELRHLRYFVAVAEELSFSRAAERLHIAQPALSTAIRQLETELGVKLLDRTTRRVALTDAGELTLERARAALDAADSTFSVARDAATGLVGRLRIGMTPVAQASPVASVVDHCAQSHPGIALHVREEPTEGLLSALKAGEIALAIGWCARPVDGLHIEPLRDEPVVAYIEHSNTLARRQSVSLAELAGERILIGSSSRDGYSQALLALFAQDGLEPEVLPDPYPDAGLLAAAEGLGIAVGAPMGQRAAVTGLACVPVEPTRTLPYHLIVGRSDASAALERTLTAIRDLRDSSGWLEGSIDPGDR